MMRIVAIVFALLAGLASLFVSVCGGGFFVAMGYGTIHQLFHLTGTNTALAALPMLMFAAACAGVGGWVCWSCIQIIRRALSKRE